MLGINNNPAYHTDIRGQLVLKERWLLGRREDCHNDVGGSDAVFLQIPAVLHMQLVLLGLGDVYVRLCALFLLLLRFLIPPRAGCGNRIWLISIFLPQRW